MLAPPWGGGRDCADDLRTSTTRHPRAVQAPLPTSITAPAPTGLITRSLMSMLRIRSRSLPGGDPGDIVGIVLREPEFAVRAGRDILSDTRVRRNRVLGDCPTRGNAPDLVPYHLCEPDVPTGTPGDPRW